MDLSLGVHELKLTDWKVLAVGGSMLIRLVTSITGFEEEFKLSPATYIRLPPLKNTNNENVFLLKTYICKIAGDWCKRLIALPVELKHWISHFQDGNASILIYL